MRIIEYALILAYPNAFGNRETADFAALKREKRGKFLCALLKSVAKSGVLWYNGDEI